MRLDDGLASFNYEHVRHFKLDDAIFSLALLIEYIKSIKSGVGNYLFRGVLYKQVIDSVVRHSQRTRSCAAKSLDLPL